MKEQDSSEAAVDAERENMIARVRAATATSLFPTGECRWCGEPVANPKIFCHGGCAAEWQKSRNKH